MKLFKEFIKSRKQIGSIMPSSSFLINKMLKPIDFSKSLIIAEYGPGTGALTSSILSRMNSRSKLISIESNIDLYNHLHIKYNKYLSVNFFLIHDSAINIGKILANCEVDFADYIISSLPLAVIGGEVKAGIITNSKNNLTQGGYFIQYQYSLASKNLLGLHFKKINLGFSLINAPPAFIYYCQK